MPNSSPARLLLISSAPALLIMAFLFDFALQSIQVRTVEGAGLEPLMVVVFPLFEMLIVTGGMGLFWYLFHHAPMERGVAKVFAILGLVILFLPPLLFFLPVPLSWYALVQFIAPGSFIFHAAALLGLGGALHLLLTPHSARQ